MESLKSIESLQQTVMRDIANMLRTRGTDTGASESVLTLGGETEKDEVMELVIRFNGECAVESGGSAQGAANILGSIFEDTSRTGKLIASPDGIKVYMESLTDDSGGELVYFGADDWGALKDRMDSLLSTSY